MRDPVWVWRRGLALFAMSATVILSMARSAGADDAAGWVLVAVPQTRFTVQYPETWSPLPANDIAEPPGKHNEFMADSTQGDVMVVASVGGKLDRWTAGLAEYTAHTQAMSRQVHGTVINALKTTVGDFTAYRSLRRYVLFGHPVVYGELVIVERPGTAVVVYATVGADDQAVVEGILNRVSQT